MSRPKNVTHRGFSITIHDDPSENHMDFLKKSIQQIKEEEHAYTYGLKQLKRKQSELSWKRAEEHKKRYQKEYLTRPISDLKQDVRNAFFDYKKLKEQKLNMELEIQRLKAMNPLERSDKTNTMVNALEKQIKTLLDDIDKADQHMKDRTRVLRTARRFEHTDLRKK